MFGKYFGIDDVMQQLVGGILLAGPFVVTEEVWALGRNMTFYHLGAILVLQVLIGYGGLFRAEARNEIGEVSFLGVPGRFISLILVAWSSVLLMAFLFTAPVVFGADVAGTIKALSIAGIFSIVGALTADSIL